MQSVESLQTNVQSIVNDLNSLKKGIEDQKSALEDQRNDQGALVMLQQAQQRFIEQQEQAKNNLLQQTKGQETIFKKLMDKANSDVASIKNQLYQLDDVGVSMTFQEALNHAEFAASKTGVRPAFLLAILKKETSWGTNVGTGSWRSDMKAGDQDDFVAICKELGFDPDMMPVSRRPSYGWGGAMGAAQFLPSTWRSYEKQIAQLTGHNPPNPWSLDDAFTAAAVKLSNNGANQKTYNAEWKAAMLYFAGSRWNNPVYSFYGNSVMGFAAALQKDIDMINGN
jgi:membrane-bound lytic murein transglycosylase B